MTMRNAATERDHAASLAHRQAMSHTLNLFASCVGIYDECRQCRNTCRTPPLLTYAAARPRRFHLLTAEGLERLVLVRLLATSILCA